MDILNMSVEDAQGLPVIHKDEDEMEVSNAVITDPNNKPDKRHILIQLDSLSEPVSRTVYHYIGLPSPDDSPKVKEQKKFALRQFCDAFGVDPSNPFQGFRPDDDSTPELPKGELPEWVGKSGWVQLSTENRPQFGEQNRVKGFVPKR